MKLLTFQAPGAAHVGCVAKEGIVDLTRALRVTHPAFKGGDSMLGIIKSGIDIDRMATDSLDQLRKEGRLKTYLVENPAYLPPILNPPKILALALNYPSHIAETNLDFFNEPIVFEKYPSTMVGHGAEIELPPFPQKVDEEHELAVILSKDARHIRPSEARDHVFGYTICNDVSARQRQGERFKMGQPYSYAKNFATFCPMGPWIVTAKELPNPSNLRQEVRINGKVRRKGNTKDMIFNPFEVIAYCSDYAPLEAGDVISLGTYAGDKNIHAGDKVELVTDKLGTLMNKVVKAKAPWASFTTGKPTGPMVKEKRRARR
jgi:2-keto-4-pentenoate hydratase/2-oxohepta-3-ene-1,7-dioic acid hydratase in catechol pathway